MRTSLLPPLLPPLALLLLLLLGVGPGRAACPTVTRPTLYGDETLICSGRGSCSAGGKCQCEDGALTAAKREAGWRDLCGLFQGERRDEMGLCA
jgi:hypothetical protein